MVASTLLGLGMRLISLCYTNLHVLQKEPSQTLPLEQDSPTQLTAI